MTRIHFAAALLLTYAGACWAQPAFPGYPYYLPAVAQGGGPVYVIPGLTTQTSTIGFSVSGQACEQSTNIACFNAAGVITVKGGTKGSNVGEAGLLKGTFGGYSGQFNYGALLMSIEGVGTVQVFPASPANGLHSHNPPKMLTLPPTSFSGLGFPAFTKENARITFYVVDDYYPDNSEGFLINLKSPGVVHDTSRPSTRIKQVNGPCDWATWAEGQGPCNPTAASASKSEVLGNDLGSSFLDRSAKQSIFLFGDTIGVRTPIHPPSENLNRYPKFHAADAIATAPIQRSAAQFKLDFLSGSHSRPVFVTPSAQPGSSAAPVPMGPDDVPIAGIHIQGKNYIVVDTGADTANPGAYGPHTFSYSVLVRDEGNSTFTSGRTISVANKPNAIKLFNPQQTGHFVFIALATLPLPFAQQIGFSEPGVLMIGNGEFRTESLFLAVVPESQFWSGGTFAPATRYFAGWDATNLPKWTDQELDAVPIINDETAGNASIAYDEKLSLWLMTWDGGRQLSPPTGVYFSSSPSPWGPWSAPQLVYNACDAHSYGQGYGDFIHYYATKKNDVCAGRVVSGTGPAGPIIGTLDDDPFYGSTASPVETAMTRRGEIYAPFMIPELNVLNGGSLSIHYNMSTWNPYAVVLMQSNFVVTQPLW